MSPPDDPLIVLVVDDEGLTRSITVDVFEALGCRVLEAADGQGAQVMLERHPEINFVFSDIRMPHLDGIELALTLKEHHPRLRVVLTSGYTDKTIPAGVRFVAKPWRDDDLANLVLEMRALADPG